MDTQYEKKISLKKCIFFRFNFFTRVCIFFSLSSQHYTSYLSLFVYNKYQLLVFYCLDIVYNFSFCLSLYICVFPSLSLPFHLYFYQGTVWMMSVPEVQRRPIPDSVSLSFSIILISLTLHLYLSFSISRHCVDMDDTWV